MQVDLHIHSTASDGTWTPPEVVAAALAAGLGAIAVTDHDSVANVAATHELAVAAGLKFIPGAEICSTKDDFCFHILGYGIDVTNKQLMDLLEHNERLLNSKDDESIKMLIERGWPLDFEEFLRYDYDRRRGGWKALAFLQDKGLCGDVNDFSAGFLPKNMILVFRFSFDQRSCGCHPCCRRRSFMRACSQQFSWAGAGSDTAGIGEGGF